MEFVQFSHIWDHWKGWLPTSLKPGDFIYVEILGTNDIDGIIYLGFTQNRRRYILCDKTHTQKLLKK